MQLTISHEKALHDHPMFGKEHQPSLQKITELDNRYHLASKVIFLSLSVKREKIMDKH